MTESGYSPRLRTGVIFCGEGTAGAYQAGVLRALTEAGVKIDVVAAHGAGVAGAMLGAIDGGTRLWSERGPWHGPRLVAAYRWRTALRVASLGLLAALLLLLSPLLVLLVAAAIYAMSVVTALVNMPTVSEQLVSTYGDVLTWLFSPPVLPTIVPRAVVLALLLVVGVLAVAAARAMRGERSRRRVQGAFWWKLLGAPLDPEEPASTMTDALWQLVRGASDEPRPAPAEIGRRYVDVLADNLGQPGFREVLVAVHDLDARRDLIGAVLPPAAREAFETRRVPDGSREAESVDLTGPQRSMLVDFLIASWRLPVVTAAHPVVFPTDGYWRGERHHLCDRPELVTRLVDEVAGIGVEQLILVSPAARPAVPHGIRARPIDLRARIGQIVRSIESAALRDAQAAAGSRFAATFVIRPDHNPIGPFDFGGVYDEASDRERKVADLLTQGYEDGYRQFIEPVVAAGERGDDA